MNAAENTFLFPLSFFPIRSVPEIAGFTVNAIRILLEDAARTFPYPQSMFPRQIFGNEIRLVERAFQERSLSAFRDKRFTSLIMSYVQTLLYADMFDRGYRKEKLAPWKLLLVCDLLWYLVAQSYFKGDGYTVLEIRKSARAILANSPDAAIVRDINRSSAESMNDRPFMLLLNLETACERGIPIYGRFGREQYLPSDT